MKKITLAVGILVSLSAFANERVSIAKSFVGSYQLKYELANDTKSPCAPELEIAYWADEKFLDLQFINHAEGIYFVNFSPRTREYLENSYVFDVLNKVNISEDEKYKTTTRINTTRIEERTYKGKPDKYEIETQTYLSKNPFNQQIRFEFVDKKLKRKECLYE